MTRRKAAITRERRINSVSSNDGFPKNPDYQKQVSTADHDAAAALRLWAVESRPALPLCDRSHIFGNPDPIDSGPKKSWHGKVDPAPVEDRKEDPRNGLPAIPC